MADRFNISIEGLDELQGALRELGPSFQSRVYGPALGAMAAVVRKRARIPNFGFTDLSGRLRGTIRSERIPARYGARVYRSGRAQVVAGGKGARQPFLVEEGHGGERGPARPHRFLTRALVQTQNEQLDAFTAVAGQRFRNAVQRAIIDGKLIRIRLQS